MNIYFYAPDVRQIREYLYFSLQIPDGKFDPQSIAPRWMLLSYKKAATTSFSKQGYKPALGTNESLGDWWCADTAAPGQWYQEDGVTARYLRVTGHQFPYQSAVAISGLRVFGHGGGHPLQVVTASAVRTGSMDASLSWPHDANATGYNVRYGSASDKLYSSWLVYGECTLRLPFLNTAQRDFFLCGCVQ